MTCQSCTLEFGDRILAERPYCCDCGTGMPPTHANYTNLALEHGQLYHVFVWDIQQVCPNCGRKSWKGYAPCENDGEAEEVAHALELVTVGADYPEHIGPEHYRIEP